MNTEMNRNGDQLAMSVSGRLDTTTAPQLEKIVEAELEGVKDLVIDCEKLDYISSAGLRLLLKLQKKLNAVGSMKLIHVNEANMEVFNITGFDQILTIE